MSNETNFRHFYCLLSTEDSFDLFHKELNNLTMMDVLNAIWMKPGLT